MSTERYTYRDGDVAFEFWWSEPGPDSMATYYCQALGSQSQSK